MKRRQAPSPSWTEGEAKSLLQAAQDSGLSLQAFAKQRGFPVERLYKWRHLNDRPDANRPGPHATALPLQSPSQQLEVVLPSGIIIRKRCIGPMDLIFSVLWECRARRNCVTQRQPGKQQLRRGAKITQRRDSWPLSRTQSHTRLNDGSKRKRTTQLVKFTRTAEGVLQHEVIPLGTRR